MLSVFAQHVMWWFPYINAFLLLAIMLFLVDPDLIRLPSPRPPHSDPTFKPFLLLSTPKTNFITAFAVFVSSFQTLMILLNWVIDFVAPLATRFRFINPHVFKISGWLMWFPALVASLMLDSSFNAVLTIIFIYILPAICFLAVALVVPNASLVYEDKHRESKLYVGNAWAAKNLKVLKDLGVTAILELHMDKKNPTAEESEAAAEYLEGITLKQVEVNDYASFWPFWKKKDSIADVLPQLLRFLQFELQQNKRGGVVLLHCAAGVSRSVSVAAAWLVKARECSGIDQAKLLLEQRRPMADMSLDHLESLREVKKF